jgi:hypothetical protein
MFNPPQSEANQMGFDEETIQKVWEKGKIVPNYDKDKWRKDQCNAWIKRDKYGDRSSKYGWEIDHIDPEGGDALSNLRPLQWENNVATGEGKLKCVVTSKGNKNVDVEK